MAEIRHIGRNPVFKFPATPEGRQLLREMLHAATVDSLPPGHDFSTCDFDDLAAYLALDDTSYERWRKEHGRGVE